MRALMVAVVVLALAGSSGAQAIDRDAFAKRLGKYGTVDLAKPKGMCWCKSGFGPFPGSGTAGFVLQEVYGSSVSVSCMIPEFNLDGSFIDYIGCYVEWDMLGK
jgi:hypothetical protein